MNFEELVEILNQAPIPREFSLVNPMFYPDSYLCHLQDTCNRKSNQQNLGTIKSSNLCTEIIEYTSPTETAVCNLASIALPRFVREKVNWTCFYIWGVFVFFCLVCSLVSQHRYITEAYYPPQAPGGGGGRAVGVHLYWWCVNIVSGGSFGVSSI